MANVGLNISRDGSTPLADLVQMNVNWVRVVLMPDYDHRTYFRTLKGSNIKILGVIAKESFTNGIISTTQLDAYNQLYGDILSAVQSGNEPDGEGESSWTMMQSEYVALGRKVRRAFSPVVAVVGGGLCSGQPDWLNLVDMSWASALGIHAYLKDAPNPDDLEDLTDITILINAYKQATDLPLWVSEWGWWGAEPKRSGEEVYDMMGWVAGTQQIIGLMYFCWSDLMVPPFGLYNTKHNIKSTGANFKLGSAEYLAIDWPELEPAPPVLPEPKPHLAPWLFWEPETMARILQVSLDNVKVIWPKAVEQLSHAGINTFMVQVSLASNIAQETAHRFWPINEFRNADGSIPAIWYSYDGGPDYHGRGLIQNTHLYNYRALGPTIARLWGAGVDDPNFDFVTYPDNLLDPDISAAAAAVYFRDKPGLVEAAEEGNFREVRRLINGGYGGLAEISAMSNNLIAEANDPAIPEEPTIPEECEVIIDEYKTAMRVLVKDIMPRLAQSATIREEAMAEALRILKQYGAE